MITELITPTIKVIRVKDVPPGGTFIIIDPGQQKYKPDSQAYPIDVNIFLRVEGDKEITAVRLHTGVFTYFTNESSCILVRPLNNKMQFEIDI